MATGINASGSQTATLATDHTLATATGTSGPLQGFMLRVDTANLANGETLTLTLSTKARSSDTTRVIYKSVFSHVQSEPIKDSPIVLIQESNEVKAVLRQEGGSGRAYPWVLFQVAG